MAFIPAPQAARFELLFTQQGQKVENVFHAVKDDGFTELNLLTFAAVYKDWWNANLRTLTHDGLYLNSIKATALDADTSPGIEYASGLPIHGNISGMPAPMNVTVAVKWLSTLRGRSYRGRTYHLGLTQGQLNASELNTGVGASLQTAYGYLITVLAAAGGVPVVVSYRHNKAPRTTAATTSITTVTVENILDSQRRRLPGRGS